MRETGVYLGTDFALPERVSAGQTIVYVSGWCFSAEGPATELQLTVDGEAQRLIASRVPRYDVYKRFRRSPKLRPRAYRSGFWGLASLPADKLGTVSVGVRLRIGRRTVDAVLGQIVVSNATSTSGVFLPAPTHAGGPSVAICLATHNPSSRHFDRQIASIQQQTHRNWICIVSDDASETNLFDSLRQRVSDDPRFVVRRNAHRLGFYWNFAACLQEVPEHIEYVALSDQDDYWHPDKLSSLLEKINADGALLAFSDMRIVGESGEILRSSFWRPGRRNNTGDLASLLCMNTVTGAASLFRRGVLSAALPFPLLEGQYHDHWIACVALALGDLAYVPRPLFDYVQHSTNVLGHRSLAGALTPVRGRAQFWYFANVIGAMAFSREILNRVGQAIEPGKRETLERFTELDTLAGLANTAGRALRHPSNVYALRILLGEMWRWWSVYASLIPNDVTAASQSALPARAATD